MATSPTAPASTGTTGMATAPAGAQGLPLVLHGGLDLVERWDQVARCREHDATLFFGPNRFEPKHERLARESEAKAVCATCPALTVCREHALRQGEPYGVWGGLSEHERRVLLEARGTALRAG